MKPYLIRLVEAWPSLRLAVWGVSALLVPIVTLIFVFSERSVILDSSDEAIIRFHWLTLALGVVLCVLALLATWLVPAGVWLQGFWRPIVQLIVTAIIGYAIATGGKDYVRITPQLLDNGGRWNLKFADVASIESKRGYKGSVTWTVHQTDRRTRTLTLGDLAKNNEDFIIERLSAYGLKVLKR